MVEPKEKNIQIGNRIKNIRLSLGKDLASFGESLTPPASASLVSRWERGINLPNSSRIKSIAQIGRVSVNYLQGINISKDFNEEDIKKIFSLIKKEHISEGDQIYKNLYDPIYEKKIFDNLLKTRSFDNLTEVGIKQTITDYLDKKLEHDEMLQRYLPYSDENGIQLAQDKLDQTLKIINEYFMNHHNLSIATFNKINSAIKNAKEAINKK